MVSFSLVTLLGVMTGIHAIGAPRVADSPTNIKYTATFDKTIHGSVQFTSTNGTVLVEVNLSNMPEHGGPFMYHIHEKSVPQSGECSGTLGHFNPYNGKVGAPTAAEKEVGDLSGKYGEISGTSTHRGYFDPYLSLNPENKAYLGGLSVVVHLKNSTRIACANITENASVVVGGASKLGDGIYPGINPGLPLAVGAAALLI